MIRARRYLRPSRLPHPVLDAHMEAFFSGIAIGAVLMLAVCVIVWKTGVLR